MMTDAPKSFRFDHAMRLHGRRAFAAVYAGALKKHQGPITLFGLPNGADRLRLGLSVSRRVGIAVKRNRIKRLLRDAFRLGRHDWPRGYDLIVVVRPHEAVTLAEYQRLLSTAIRSLHLEWERRKKKEGT